MKTEEMEDNNSWNEVIFRQIKARSEWLSSLIWRNQQKLKVDASEEKNDDAGNKKKIDLDPSDKSMLEWFEERQENFKRKSEEEDQPLVKDVTKARGRWRGGKEYPSGTEPFRGSIAEEEQKANLSQCEVEDVKQARGRWRGGKEYPSGTEPFRDDIAEEEQVANLSQREVEGRVKLFNFTVNNLRGMCPCWPHRLGCQQG